MGGILSPLGGSDENDEAATGLAGFIRDPSACLPPQSGKSPVLRVPSRPDGRDEVRPLGSDERAAPEAVLRVLRDDEGQEAKGIGEVVVAGRSRRRRRCGPRCCALG